ncbi:hypothetical protein cypCar_00000795 [Cyprinus carpio]|nr:hypothetical protein cypCar_00000795 [Cyprinus carpio]
MMPSFGYLFMGDLYPHVTEPFGPICFVQVCRDSKTNLSCGFRYVNLTHRQHVLNALNALIELTGKPIRLMWAETDSTLRKSVIGNIIIKGLAKDINNLALSRTFSGFRKILSSRVVCDSNKEQKGYGFIHYTTLKAAGLVIKKLDGTLLSGYLVSICHFKTHKEHQAEQKSSSKPPQKKDFSLYVQNMPYSLGSEELGTLFSAFGEVTSATVIKKKRRSMGYGFVTYSSLDDAVIATSVMNGYIVGNRPLRVTFSHSAEKTRQIEQPINATFCRRRAGYERTRAD